MSQNSKSNFEAYQKLSKKQTLEKIDCAIHDLHEKRLPINVSAIADEAGLSRQAMYASYIKDFLENHPLFPGKSSPEQDTIQSLEAKINQLTKQIERLEKQKEILAKGKKELKAENDKLHDRLSDLSRKYKLLLGKYQTDMEQKIIRF